MSASIIRAERDMLERTHAARPKSASQVTAASANSSIAMSSCGGVIQLLRDRKREHVDVALFSRVDYAAHHPASIALLMEESRRRRLLRQRIISHISAEVIQREEIQRFALKGYWFVWIRLVHQLMEAAVDEIETRTRAAHVSITDAMDAHIISHRLKALRTFIEDEHARCRFATWGRFLLERSRVREEAEYAADLRAPAASPARPLLPAALQDVSPIADVSGTPMAKHHTRLVSAVSSSSRLFRTVIDEHELSLGGSFAEIAHEALQCDMLQSHGEYLSSCVEKQEQLARNAVASLQQSSRANELRAFLLERPCAWIPRFANLMLLEFCFSALHEAEWRLRMDIAVQEGCAVVEVVLYLRICHYQLKEQKAPRRLRNQLHDGYLWEAAACVVQRVLRGFAARAKLWQHRTFWRTDCVIRAQLYDRYQRDAVVLKHGLDRAVENIRAAILCQRIGRGVLSRSELRSKRNREAPGNNEHLALLSEEIARDAIACSIPALALARIQDVGRGWLARRNTHVQLSFWSTDKRARQALMRVAGCDLQTLLVKELVERECTARQGMQHSAAQAHRTIAAQAEEVSSRQLIVTHEHDDFSRVLDLNSAELRLVLLSAEEALDRSAVIACQLAMMRPIFFEAELRARECISDEQCARARRHFMLLEDLCRRVLAEKWWSTFDTLTAEAEASDASDQDTLEDGDVVDDVASTLSETTADQDTAETISSSLDEERDEAFANDALQQELAIRCAIERDEYLWRSAAASQFYEVLRICTSTQLGPSLYNNVAEMEAFDRSVVSDAHTMLMLYYIESAEVEQRRIFLFTMTKMMALFYLNKLELLRRCAIDRQMRDEWDAVFGHDDADDKTQESETTYDSSEEADAASPKSNASGATRAPLGQQDDDDDELDISTGLDSDSTHSEFSIESGSSHVSEATGTHKTCLSAASSLALATEEASDRRQIVSEYFGKISKFAIAQEYFCRHANVLGEASIFFSGAITSFRALREAHEAEAASKRPQNSRSGTLQKQQSSSHSTPVGTSKSKAANYLRQLDEAKNVRWI